MSRKRYSPERIIEMSREAEVAQCQGETAEVVCWQVGDSDQSYHRLRKEQGGLKIDQAKHPKDLEKENNRLRRACLVIGQHHSTQRKRAR